MSAMSLGARTILEVGPGYRPAIASGGTDFTPEVRCMAIGTPVPDDCLHKYAQHGIEFIEADLVDLSRVAPDKSIDTIIMRSVFGEYTMPPAYTSSSLANTRLGLYEVFRKLRGKGQVVIAEENTPEAPAHPSQTGGVLLNAGFDNIKVMPCQNLTNPHWVAERTRFWALDRDPPINQGWSYIITAEKPELGPNEIEIFEGTVLLTGLLRATYGSVDTHDTPPYIIKPFQRRKMASRSQDGITIVARETTLTMTDYLQGLHSGTVGQLFKE